VIAAAAFALLGLVLGTVALVAGGGDDEQNAGLRVERSTELPELRVFVAPGDNTTERAGGRRSVTVECVDPDGGVVASQSEPWPFTDTDQGTLDPHAHVQVDPAGLGDVERCRLRRTEPLLEGPVL
jgi:hypothetical protein